MCVSVWWVVDVFSTLNIIISLVLFLGCKAVRSGEHCKLPECDLEMGPRVLSSISRTARIQKLWPCQHCGLDLDLQEVWPLPSPPVTCNKCDLCIEIMFV